MEIFRETPEFGRSLKHYSLMEELFLSGLEISCCCDNRLSWANTPRWMICRLGC